MTKKACSSGRSIELEPAGADGAASLVIRFPFDVGIVAVIRSLPKRRFDPFAKCWRVPPEQIVGVVDALVPREFQVESTARALYIQCGGALTLASSSSTAPEAAPGKLPPPRCRGPSESGP